MLASFSSAGHDRTCWPRRQGARTDKCPLRVLVVTSKFVVNSNRLARVPKQQPLYAAIATWPIPGMMRNSMTFPLHRSISAIACAMVFTASCAAAEVIPQELAVDRNGGAVAVTRYAAEGTASRPALLVLHGAGGLK